MTLIDRDTALFMSRLIRAYRGRSARYDEARVLQGVSLEIPVGSCVTYLDPTIGLGMEQARA